MRKILFGLMSTILLLGCSPKDSIDTKVEAKLVIGKSLDTLVLNDQFKKAQKINANTTKLIFAFSKDMAHICNDFFATQSSTYLDDNYTQFVADVSTAPSIIRSMFIMPGLKDFEHKVLILDNENIAMEFRADIDVEKIVVVHLDKNVITKIKTIVNVNELKSIIENK